ncbi:MAG: 50S ribosomal protein L6 [Bacteroidetes bacterium]|nr:50S ribosomal protein L6 [Bacteroidota bacterium]
MSRIGDQEIQLPPEVNLEISGDNLIKVKGSKGTLECKLHNDIKIAQENNIIKVKRPSDQKLHKSMHGLYRSLINNMVLGVSQGYKKSLELVGVGYKATKQPNYLELSLGYSHSIYFAAPKEVKITAEMLKGKNPIVHIEGIDKQLVGQVAAKIRSLRKPEPYKGKGIKFVGEIIRRKAGKTAAK